MSIQELSFSGTYYDVGKALGSTAKKEVNYILTVFQRSQIYKKLQRHLSTPDILNIVEGFESLTEEHCPDIVSELRGVADGANVDYRELFLLNLEPEWLALFSDVPESSHGIKFSSTFDGCTNIILPVAGTNQIYLGHTEDICPEIKHCGFIVHHEIYKTDQGTCDGITECFTEYVLPGILAGSKFGFNSHGLMFAHNNIYQQGLNKTGIPRRFVFRALVSSRNIGDAIKKLKTFSGIATGYTFNCLYKEDINSDKKVVHGVFEGAGDETAGHMEEISSQPVDRFQHLNHPCHPEESSLRREAILKQLVSRGQLASHSDLLKALSNKDDKVYPIYRNGNSPDYLSTGAIGVFDSLALTMTVYGDLPVSSKGQEINILRTKHDYLTGYSSF